MEKTKIIHPLYFHEDGTSALKAEVQDTSCKLVGLPGNKKYENCRENMTIIWQKKSQRRCVILALFQ